MALVTICVIALIINWWPHFGVWSVPFSLILVILVIVAAAK